MKKILLLIAFVIITPTHYACIYPSVPLQSKSGQIVKCNLNESTTCPNGYVCTHLWLGQTICCTKRSKADRESMKPLLNVLQSENINQGSLVKKLEKDTNSSYSSGRIIKPPGQKPHVENFQKSSNKARATVDVSNHVKLLPARPSTPQQQKSKATDRSKHLSADQNKAEYGINKQENNGTADNPIGPNGYQQKVTESSDGKDVTDLPTEIAKKVLGTENLQKNPGQTDKITGAPLSTTTCQGLLKNKGKNCADGVITSTQKQDGQIETDLPLVVVGYEAERTTNSEKEQSTGITSEIDETKITIRNTDSPNETTGTGVRSNTDRNGEIITDLPTKVNGYDGESSKEVVTDLPSDIIEGNENQKSRNTEQNRRIYTDLPLTDIGDILSNNGYPVSGEGNRIVTDLPPGINGYDDQSTRFSKKSNTYTDASGGITGIGVESNSTTQTSVQESSVLTDLPLEFIGYGDKPTNRNNRLTLSAKIITDLPTEITETGGETNSEIQTRSQVVTDLPSELIGYVDKSTKSQKNNLPTGIGVESKTEIQENEIVTDIPFTVSGYGEQSTNDNRKQLGQKGNLGLQTGITGIGVQSNTKSQTSDGEVITDVPLEITGYDSKPTNVDVGYEGQKGTDLPLNFVGNREKSTKSKQQTSDKTQIVTDLSESEIEAIYGQRKTTDGEKLQSENLKTELGKTVDSVTDIPAEILNSVANTEKSKNAEGKVTQIPLNVIYTTAEYSDSTVGGDNSKTRITKTSTRIITENFETIATVKNGQNNIGGGYEYVTDIPEEILSNINKTENKFNQTVTDIPSNYLVSNAGNNDEISTKENSAVSKQSGGAGIKISTKSPNQGYGVTVGKTKGQSETKNSTDFNPASDIPNELLSFVFGKMLNSVMQNSAKNKKGKDENSGGVPEGYQAGSWNNYGPTESRGKTAKGSNLNVTNGRKTQNPNYGINVNQETTIASKSSGLAVEGTVRTISPKTMTPVSNSILLETTNIPSVTPSFTKSSKTSPAKVTTLKSSNPSSSHGKTYTDIPVEILSSILTTETRTSEEDENFSDTTIDDVNNPYNSGKNVTQNILHEEYRIL